MQEGLFIFERNFWLKLVIALCYFIFIIGIESIYRKYLFDVSIDIIYQMQEYFQSSMEFFNFITKLGTIQCFFPFLAFIFIFYPINKGFLILSLIIHSSYWDNLMKIIYGDPRPFWEDSRLKPSCNGGYGNPSGHAFSSTAVFLGIPLAITDIDLFKKRNIIYRILVYIFFIALMIFVILSRIVLAAHSINQVLYGSLLGLGVYFIHCHLFNLVNPKPKIFFEIFKNKILITIFSAFYSSMLIAILIVYFKIDNYNIKYISLMTAKCYDKENYRMFNPDGLFNALSIFGLIGGHLGLVFLVHYIDKYFPSKYDEIFNWDWNRQSLKNLIIKCLFTLVATLPLALFFIIPGSSDLGIIYVFKVSIPYFVSSFLIFGPCVWLFIYKKYANQKIYVLDITHSDSELKKIEEYA